MNLESVDATSIIIQLLVTIAGVLLSFVLWFGGEKLIKKLNDKSTRQSLMKEITEELKENILILGSSPDNLNTILKNNNIPLHFARLLNSAAKYAVESGGVRLCGNFEQQRIIRLLADLYSRHNEFAANTESILIHLFVNPNARPLIMQRLDGYKALCISKKTIMLDRLQQLDHDKSFKHVVAKSNHKS